ncbi:protein MAIN-LIKE 1-like [Vicia villosa]|uniref:protein MAIN-LIKE 1-like n=1 Tax=Vicia villosa TaxID=3911 RepID=UPI00273AA6F2|nr:protein MAIN-LIKE 1-like [Vicia villosa]
MSGNQARLRQGRETQMTSARHERVAQLVATRGRGRVRVLVQMDEARTGSSSGLRSRLPQVSSSREVDEDVVEEHQEEVKAPEEEGVRREEAQGDEDEGYPGGPSDTSRLIWYHEHVARRVWEGERAAIKSVNHARKIFDIEIPEAQWFSDVVVVSGLSGLYMIGYGSVSHRMLGAFFKRWHKETSSFPLPVRELTITFYDVAFLLHLPIRGRLLDHSHIQWIEAIEWMVDFLGMDPFMAERECQATSGELIRFSNLRELYEDHLVAAAEVEEEGDAFYVEYHRCITLRCWFMFLVGTMLFVDKSANYVDMTYLRYFIDLSRVQEWNWGGTILGWIISYFYRIHGYEINPVYTDAMPRAARYILQRGNNKVGPYRVYLNHIVHDDIQWTPFIGYGDVIPFDRIRLYFGWLPSRSNTMVKYLPEQCMRQFGHVQMILKSPFHVAPDTVTSREIAAIFEDWAHHLVLKEYRSMVATKRWHCVDGYVTWFYRVSHPLVTPDAPGDPPRPSHEEILENRQAEDDQATDILPVCQRI